jgi:hypothetical protein
MNYEQTMYDLLEEQVAGFYDPDAKQLFIADWLGSGVQGPTLAHELVHALQDQHYDIAARTHHTHGQGDAQIAMMAVLEGDATLAMFDFAGGGRGVQIEPERADMLFKLNVLASFSQPKLSSAPRALRETLLFPYRRGFTMCVRAYRDGGGYPGIDALLSMPPSSTEQVLHPAKLASREPPVLVNVPSGALPNYVVMHDDVLGELNTQLFLAEKLPDDEAEQGAAGWGGDRAVLLIPRATGAVAPNARADAGAVLPAGSLDASVLVWKLVFDPSASDPDGEAKEFERFAQAVLERRYNAGSRAAVAGTTAAFNAGSGTQSVIARTGSTVVLIDHAPAADVAALVAWASAP